MKDVQEKESLIGVKGTPQTNDRSLLYFHSRASKEKQI